MQSTGHRWVHLNYIYIRTRQHRPPTTPTTVVTLLLLTNIITTTTPLHHALPLLAEVPVLNDSLEDLFLDMVRTVLRLAPITTNQPNRKSRVGVQVTVVTTITATTTTATVITDVTVLLLVGALPVRRP